MQEDIQAIIDYSHSFAELMLNESKEYYPFGVKIDNDGVLIPVLIENNETDMPKSQDVIDQLLKHCQAELEKKKIRAYGITYDVRVKTDNSDNKSDAILIDIRFQDSQEIPIYYFTYYWSDNNELIFGESYGMKRE